MKQFMKMQKEGQILWNLVRALTPAISPVMSSRNLHEISYRVEFQFHTINDLFFGLKYAKIDILLFMNTCSCSMMVYELSLSYFTIQDYFEFHA